MRYPLLLIFFAVLTSCGDNRPGSGEQSLQDLERAVTAIEDRQQAEYKIIEEQKRAIKVLESNLKKVNSEGMRTKIRNDINEKYVIIKDAEVNLANQNEILEELYASRDSLMNE